MGGGFNSATAGPTWLNQKRDGAIGDLREWRAAMRLCGGRGASGVVEKERATW